VGTRITLRAGDSEFVAEINPAGTVTVDGREFRLSELADGSVRLDGDDAARRGWTAVAADTVWAFVDGRVFTFERPRLGSRRKRGGVHHGSLSAPMPATVRRIDVKAGDVVKKGQTLILLEAMKMELPVRAAGDGTVTSVNCREGELVQPGATLVELDEAD
jgi:3-methylcrotonyl-CoA carboxylase alpha subunit